ncbi:MAG: UDP-N-acetylmuramoyl-tripeptide--D-alanyl-D-alanine ligase, partial [Phycisphaerae bacterium]
HQFIPEAASKGAVACVCRRAWFSAVGAALARRLGPCLVVADTVEALGRLATYYRRNVMHVATVVVAVTGTNGKTTTKAMIDHVLCRSLKGRAAPKSFNNQIGVPLTLLSADADDRYLIVEIGTNSPGEVAALAAITSPDAAVITSISEAHLQGLGGMDGVAAEKVSLLGHVRLGGLAVVNIDRYELRTHLAGATRARVLTVGTNPVARLRIANACGNLRGTEFEIDGRFHIELNMPGMHHAANAAAAFAVARWFAVAPEDIIGRLRSFRPLEGRTRLVEIGGLTVIDDAYNANPASMAAAVETLGHEPPGRRVFVMGDMLELGPGSASFHQQAVRAVMEAGIETLVAVGSLTAEAVRTIDTSRYGTRVVLCEDAEAASDALTRILSIGDRVWVKGSRAMRLDYVISHLQAHFSHKAAVA